MIKILATILFLIPVIFFSSCKKMIEDKQKDAFIAAMITGQWLVESYTEGTELITDQFKGYHFQFKEDGSVLSSYETVISTGTWVGDIENYSISSNFPSAEDPLRKLNGLWKITKTGKNFVQAEMKTMQGKMFIQLKKIP